MADDRTRSGELHRPAQGRAGEEDPEGGLEKVDILEKTKIVEIVCDEDKRIAEIHHQPTVFDSEDETWIPDGEIGQRPRDWDYVVMAVPARALDGLVSEGVPGERVVDVEPGLASLKRLGSQAVPILHLCFTRELDGVPKGPVGLFGSKLNLAFTDISKAWKDKGDLPEKKTVLAVSCSDTTMLVGGLKENAMAIIKELAEYLCFCPGDKWGESRDIEWGNREGEEWLPTAGLDPGEAPPPVEAKWPVTRFHENTDAQLSLNAIGTDDCRPGACCPNIQELVLAGDFCQHYAGMMTVEAAVVSGLAAVREIVKQRGGHPDAAVPITKPDTWPEEVFVAARYAWGPSVQASKAWAMATGEWREAMPPVDVGAGVFGDSPNEPADEHETSTEESLLRYLLTPG